ncbi:MAG TPA: hypothetical protein VMI72_07465 [Roseiarcus sp.]|nr:hypothetical protein [Roseiarcus sp.]
MDEVHAEGAPFLFATGAPPSAAAQDDDVYLTVTAATPPEAVSTIDIILSVEYAERAIDQLRVAVVAAKGSDRR